MYTIDYDTFIECFLQSANQNPNEEAIHILEMLKENNPEIYFSHLLTIINNSDMSNMIKGLSIKTLSVPINKHLFSHEDLIIQFISIIYSHLELKNEFYESIKEVYKSVLRKTKNEKLILFFFQQIHQQTSDNIILDILKINADVIDYEFNCIFLREKIILDILIDLLKNKDNKDIKSLCLRLIGCHEINQINEEKFLFILDIFYSFSEEFPVEVSNIVDRHNFYSYIPYIIENEPDFVDKFLNLFFSDFKFIIYSEILHSIPGIYDHIDIEQLFNIAFLYDINTKIENEQNLSKFQRIFNNLTKRINYLIQNEPYYSYDKIIPICLKIILENLQNNEERYIYQSINALNDLLDIETKEIICETIDLQNILINFENSRQYSEIYIKLYTTCFCLEIIEYNDEFFKQISEDFLNENDNLREIAEIALENIIKLTNNKELIISLVQFLLETLKSNIDNEIISFSCLNLLQQFSFDQELSDQFVNDVFQMFSLIFESYIVYFSIFSKIFGKIMEKVTENILKIFTKDIMNILTQSYDDYEDDTIFLLEKMIQRVGNENNEIINVSINIVLEKIESIGEDELRLGSIIDLIFDILKYVCNDKELLEKILYVMCDLYSKFNNEKKLVKIITFLFEFIPEYFDTDFVMSHLTQICYQSHFLDDNKQVTEFSYLVLKCKVERFHRAKMIEEGRDLAKYLNQNYLELNNLYQRLVNLIISEKNEGKKNEIIKSLFEIPFEDVIERKYIINQNEFDNLTNILSDSSEEIRKRFNIIS